jgi:acyl carrier protein phosphodiesterase
MNFLAHAYLSFHHPKITVGNLIADFVKGQRWKDYEEEIQRGIQIHRAIDEFTDRHPSTLAGREFFQPTCGRYSAVFIDIVYDHFLATDKTIFTEPALFEFSQHVYSLLNQQDNLPPAFMQMYSYMQSQNWLYNYRQMDGMYKTFTGMVRRAKYLNVTADVPFAVLETHYDELASLYRTFFAEIIAYIQQHFKL